MSTFTTYLSIANNLGRYQKMTAADPTVAQATKYFQANIGKITSADQFVNNSRLFNYAMTAFGLSDMTYAKTLIKQVLEQGTSKSTALANKLNNPKILALAQAFNFALNGASTTQTTAATTDVVSKYVMQTLETNRGKPRPRRAAGALFPAERLQNHRWLQHPRRLESSERGADHSRHFLLHFGGKYRRAGQAIRPSAHLFGFPRRRARCRISSSAFAAQYDLNNPTVDHVQRRQSDQLLTTTGRPQASAPTS